MAIDNLVETAHAAGFAMVGTDEMVAEPATWHSPDVPALREIAGDISIRERSASTALVPVKPFSLSSAIGWSFLWKATA